MNTLEKISWAKEQLKPIEIKDLKGKKHLFKLIPTTDKNRVTFDAISKLIGITRQGVKYTLDRK